MADVKWIKITTDIFDDEKILLIESMPDADTLIVIWFKLLCMAGKQNNSGVFLIHDRIPYTDEMLATIFRRPLNTVRMALEVFENFGMIETVNGIITIPNWDKHQSLDALEKKREYQRKLMREKRSKQKKLCEANSEANSEANVSFIDKSVEGEKKRIDKKCVSSDSEEKHPHHTHITLSVYDSLCSKYGKAFVDSKADKAYNDKALIKFCEQDYNRKPSSGAGKNKFNKFEQRDYDLNALEERLTSIPPPTAGNDEAIRKKAEELQERLKGEK